MFDNADIFEVLWTVIAGMIFIASCYFAVDSRNDRRALHEGSGQPAAIALATSQIVFALCIMLGASVYVVLGGYFMIRPSPTTADTPSLSSLLIRLILVCGQLPWLMGLIYVQVIRKNVLRAEQREATAILREITEQAARDLQANTAALAASKAATESLIYAINNGPLHAQQAQTIATDNLTTATDELTAATDANTVTLNINLQAADAKHVAETNSLPPQVTQIPQASVDAGVQAIEMNTAAQELVAEQLQRIAENTIAVTEHTGATAENSVQIAKNTESRRIETQRLSEGDNDATP